jgi:release factor glutamine methyltransferase
MDCKLPTEITNFTPMKIPSNRIGSVIKYFREQLSDLYSSEEVENFIAYAFEEYMGYKRAELVTRANETMSESMLLKFNFVVKDLKKQKPIQYILGNTYFCGMELKVDERVLIPRQETEELVDIIVKSQGPGIKSQDKDLRILDIGTGSGCIALALKKLLPHAEVHALDVSNEALALAEENAKANNLEITFVHGNVLEPETLQLPGTYDIIVSNPPYVLNSEKASMQPNVLQYEPHLALFVNDNDPLLFYRVILDLAKRKLNAGGSLYFEINEEQGNALVRLAEEKGMKNVTLKKDINGKDRMLSAEI